MNWDEYLPLAERTLSTEFHCEQKEELLLHAVIGSLTEVEELLDNYNNGKLVTDINKQGSVAEESSDIFWYLSILCRELNIEVSIDSSKWDMTNNEIETDPFYVLVSFTKVSLKFLDLLKKKLYYNKDMSSDLMVKYSIEMFNLLNYYCYLYNTDVSKILDKNIEKLRARYGDKFSSYKAINRDLITEKKILEN